MSDTIWELLKRAPQVLWFKRVCPRCGSVKFKQAELRFYDTFLALCGLRPVRCMFCWRRYYWVSLRQSPAG